MLKTIAKLSVSMCALALLCACGGGNYNGNYSGTITPSSGTAQNMSMTLYQSGSNVTGQWITTSGTSVSGNLTGSANGGTLNSVTFSILSGGTTTSSYTGTFSLNNNNLSGTLSGTSGTFGTTPTFNLTQSQ